ACAARAAFLEQTAGPTAIRNLRAHDVKIRIMGDFAIIHAATSYTTPDGQQANGRYNRLLGEAQREMAHVIGACDAMTRSRHCRGMTDSECLSYRKPRRQFT